MARPSEGPAATRLIDVAAEMFRTKGYAAATTRELAEMLGIQKASLYYHIRNKEDLLYRICVESLLRMRDAVEDAIGGLPAGEQLRAAISAHLETMLRDRHLHAVMLTEMRALSGDRRSEVIEQRREYETLVRDIVRSDQEAGVLRDDIDARFLTLALLDLLNWAIFWFRPDGELGVEDMTALMITIFFDGAKAFSPIDSLPTGR